MARWMILQRSRGSIDSGAEHFAFVGIPGGELARGKGALGSVEEDEKAGWPLDQPGILEGLAVTDADAVAADFAVLHLKVGADPMDVTRVNPDAAAGEAFVGMAFADVDGVGGHVGGYHEDGVLVPADVQALPLTDRVELGAIVLTDDLPPRILLVAYLLDVLLSAPVGFSLELYP